MRTNWRSESKLYGSIRPFLVDYRSDISLLTAVAALLGVIWFKVPDAHRRLIAYPLDAATNSIIDPSISYPYLPPVFDTLLVAILCVGIPIVLILVSQFSVHSFAICWSAILGFLYSVVTGTLFQVCVKKLVGGLRPHFLDVCRPRTLAELQAQSTGVGYGGLYFTAQQMCTGDMGRINNAQASFPSGHSEIAFATMVYLSMYLLAFVNPRALVSEGRPKYVKMLIVTGPIFFAVYIAGAVVLGYHHFWYDALFGALIGTCAAIAGFSMVFCFSPDGRFQFVPRVRGFENEEILGYRVAGDELSYLD